MTRKQEPETTDDRLDLIIEYMHRMDRRDKLRTFGGFVGGLLRLIPLIAFVWFSWHFYNNSDEILSRITEQAAQQAAKVARENTNNAIQTIDASELMKQFEGMFEQE